MHRRIPPDREQAMIADYLAGDGLKEVGERFGCTFQAVSTVLKRNGVATRPTAMPPETRRAMVEAYTGGATMAEAARRFGYSTMACCKSLRKLGVPSRRQDIPGDRRQIIVEAYRAGASTRKLTDLFGHEVYKLLKRAGVPMRTASDARRVHTLRQDFFASVDSEEKAYWLGFITADGCVWANAVMVNLARRDRGHLESLALAWNWSGAVTDYLGADRNGKLWPHSVLSVKSDRMVRDLAALGIHPRKTFTVRPWQGPADLMRHYWRGVVDGDGSLVHTKPCHKVPAGAWTVSLCGNQAVVEGFAQFVRHHTHSHASAFPHRNIFRVGFGGHFLGPQVAILLYADASTYLPRKMNRAQRAIALITEEDSSAHKL